MMRYGNLIVLLLASLFLAACASRETVPTPAPSTGSEQKPWVPPSKPVSRASRQAEPPAPTARPAPNPVAKPVEKPPTPPASIPQLVTAGQLESSTSKRLVFASRQSEPAEDPGLFEDAIILSRVRAGLKAAALPEYAGTARIASGSVTLEVPENAPQALVAAAVNTTLQAEGVRKVAVQFVPTQVGSGN